MVLKSNIPPIIYAYVGFILYGACGFFSMYTDAINYIKMMSVALIIWAFLKAPRNLSVNTSKTLIHVFVCYTIFILLRGSFVGNLPVSSMHEITDLYGIIRHFLTFEHSALSFFIILFILVPFNYRELRYYRVMAIVCAIICFINIYYFQDELFSFYTFGNTYLLDLSGEIITIRALIRYCFIGMGAILLFCYALTNFRRTWLDYILLTVIVLYGVAQIAGGGRGGTITAMLYIFFMLFFLMKDKGSSIWGRTIGRVFSFAIVVLVLYGTYYILFISDFADYLYSRLFAGGDLGGELKESTREDFVNMLIADLNNHPWAWLIGKGSNGSYLVKAGPRGTIEWGYWYLILKGGVIYLFLYVYLLLKTVYIGFFKSKNTLTKAMAILCLMCAYSLIPFGLPIVSLDFVLVWHYVRIINTSRIREMTDSEIEEWISLKKRKKTINIKNENTLDYQYNISRS